MNFRLLFILIISLSVIGCASSQPFTTMKRGQKKLINIAKEYKKELVCLDVRSNVKLKFLLYTPLNPTHIMIMFTGGNGKLELSDSGYINHNKENYTVRIVENIVQAGIMVALVDAPEDQMADMGLNTNSFRISDTHYQDIKKVLTYIKSQRDIPAWLLGFSMGNHSASYLASRFKNQINGLIISSAVTIWPPQLPNYKNAPRGILNLDLDQITVPTLIVYHQEDGCGVCPARNISKIKQALINSTNVEVEMITGGLSHRIPCGPLGHHGFRGKEKETINSIVEFIKSN